MLSKAPHDAIYSDLPVLETPPLRRAEGPVRTIITAHSRWTPVQWAMPHGQADSTQGRQ